jgi:hypothetical protein
MCNDMSLRIPGQEHLDLGINDWPERFIHTDMDGSGFHCFLNDILFFVAPATLQLDHKKNSQQTGP